MIVGTEIEAPISNYKESEWFIVYNVSRL
jgi:hypothetical protein